MFVAPDGRDDNDGSLAHPFSTLARALATVESGRAGIVRVAAGRYAPARTLVIGPSGDGACLLGSTAGTVLDGRRRLPILFAIEHANGVTVAGFTFTGATAGGAALTLSGGGSHRVVGNLFLDTDAAIQLDGSSADRIAGNEILGTTGSAVEVKDGSNDNILDDNLIEDTGAPDTTGGAFFLHAVSGNLISGNHVLHSAGMGIGIENWDDTTINSGNAVTGNVIIDSGRNSSDSGAIYTLGRSARDTRTIIAGNLIDGTGRSDRHAVGIYLDDSSSGVDVLNNLVRNIGSDAVEIHGGNDNLIRGNRIELGAGTPSAILFQAAPRDLSSPLEMSGNRIEENIISSRAAHPRLYVSYAGGVPEFSRNLYLGTAATIPFDRMYDTATPFRGPGPLALGHLTDTMHAASRPASCTGDAPGHGTGSSSLSAPARREPECSPVGDRMSARAKP